MQTRVKNNLIANSRAFALAALIGVFALSGCSTEKDVSGEKALIQKPILNARAAEDDFAFPTRKPRLSKGKVVFEQNCATCHTGGKMSYGKIKDVRPIDTYLMLTKGENNHPAFRNKLTRDQRWEALFYARHLTGEYDIKTKDISALFGSNCAVCHGTKGFADGTLYSGHGPHGTTMAPVKGAFDPPPANFNSASRMYNRSDTQLIKFITEGVYPSAMPSWKGRVDREKNITFDDAVILDLVKHVRKFTIEDDLPSEEAKPASGGKAPKEISALVPGQIDKLEKQHP